MQCQRALLSLLILPLAVSNIHAQLVRFDTSLGSFNIELFADKAPLNVGNFLSYVTSGRYNNTVIHRAEDSSPDFQVMQMGTWASESTAPPETFSGFLQILQDQPVTGEPASTTGLSHEIGTVGLALICSVGCDRDSGLSSFFINRTHNTQLDQDFTVFGKVLDLTTIDAIFAAETFADGRLRYGDSVQFGSMPLQTNGDMVFIRSARVIPEPSACSLLLLGLVAVMVTGSHRHTRQGRFGN